MNYLELYLDGNSIPEVSEKTGIPKSTIRFRLKKDGVLRSRSDSIRLASKKGRMSSNKGIKRIFTPEWKENIRQGKLRHGELSAKGVSRKPSGYLEITRGDNKGKSQHVVIMEEHLGRRINRSEVVHHINGVKDDNRIENLQVMSASDHMRHHAYERIKNGTNYDITKHNKGGKSGS